MNVLDLNTRYGPFLYNDCDPHFRDAIVRYGEWSWREASYWQQIVAPGDVVISAGANIGCHVVALAQLVGEGGAVFCFEPQLPLWQVCVANVALANVGAQVRAFAGALGEKDGVIQMPIPDYTKETSFGGYSLRYTSVPDHVQRYPVKQYAIDGLALTRCDFIQLDIEGMEDEALAGAKETLTRCQPVLYLEADYPQARLALFKRMERIGYRAFWHIVPFFNARNYRDNPENIWGPAVVTSWLCAPAAKAAGIDLPPVTDPMKVPA